MVDPESVHLDVPKPTVPNPDQPWVDWLIRAALDYHATVLLLPGNGGYPQGYLIPRRLN